MNENKGCGAGEIRTELGVAIQSLHSEIENHRDAEGTAGEIGAELVLAEKKYSLLFG